MIIGDIKNWQREKQAFAASIRTAIEFLRETDMTVFDRKPKQDILDSKMFATLQQYETRVKQDCRPESHRDHIDVHYLITGQEQIGVAMLDATYALVDSPADQDLLFYSGVENETDIVMKPGMYAVFFPDDIHRPRCNAGGQPSAVSKIVIKIHISLLQDEK